MNTTHTMTTPAFNCPGLAHRTHRHVGRLRATVRSLAQDMRTLIEDPDTGVDLHAIFARDLRRAHRILRETDGRTVSVGTTGGAQ